MRIEVLLFAAIRDAAGSDTIAVEVDDEASAEDVVRAVGHSLPAVAPLLPSCRLAVDSCYVAPDANVSKDCEVALIPPVSGG